MNNNESADKYVQDNEFNTLDWGLVKHAYITGAEDQRAQDNEVIKTLQEENKHLKSQLESASSHLRDATKFYNEVFEWVDAEDLAESITPHFWWLGTETRDAIAKLNNNKREE